MTLYSYVVARDYGFAPNPFFGVCTLATCKPKIRRDATVGDWVVGTGSKAYGLEGRLVFAMKVAELLSYNRYWRDSRFRAKRPRLTGSLKQAYGDNIYHRPRDGRWRQCNSHHSLPDGSPNAANIRHDTQTENVLVAWDFIYWGASGPAIPRRFRRRGLTDICALRGHKSHFAPVFIDDFIRWIGDLGVTGYVGAPAEFPVSDPIGGSAIHGGQTPARRRAERGSR